MNAEIDGELVRKLRTVKSWSQEELGQISGLSARTVQRIEAEGSSSLESRRALASAFGLRPEDLLTREPAVSGVVPDNDQTFVDQPSLGAGFGTGMFLTLGLCAIALLVSVLAIAVGIEARDPSTVMASFFRALVMVNFIGVVAYLLWAAGTTTYRLSPQGLQVRYGLHRREYRWDDFTIAYWRRGMLPFRMALQPVSRFSDVVTLERRNGGSALDLTPDDSAVFMRRIAALAPQLAGDPRR